MTISRHLNISNLAGASGYVTGRIFRHTCFFCFCNTVNKLFENKFIWVLNTN